MQVLQALRSRLAQRRHVDPRPGLREQLVVPLDAADPRPSRLNDRRFDGQISGRDGLFPPGLALRVLGEGGGLPKIRAFVPADGRAPLELLLQVNGIMTDVALHNANLQDIADRTGCAVVGIHNATTHDMVLDVSECVQNKLDRNDAMPAVHTLAALTLDALDDRLPVRLLGHSQGALVLEGTLQRVIAVRLAHHRGLGLTPAQADLAVLRDLKLISVETWGGASHCFSGGTTADLHLVNVFDLVARLLGVGSGKRTGGRNGEHGSDQD